MNILILGAAGFIGTNLSIKLMQDKKNILTLADRKKEYFPSIIREHISEQVKIIPLNIDINTNFDKLVSNQDIVYHLVSSTVPTTSNQHIGEELNANIVMTASLLDSCVKNNVKKVVFLSSGGTVYGKVTGCPISENTQQFPISTYGLQKLTIEKLLYLYQYMYGLDYRIIRLSNPYGPYQKPNGIQGVVTTFIYKAIMNQCCTVYGDGSIIRDFIYIDDAIKYIIAIANSECQEKIYNLGSGYGTSVNEIIEHIRKCVNTELQVEYKDGRQVDVPVNYLDVSRLERIFGKMQLTSLEEGIRKTADFLRSVEEHK